MADGGTAPGVGGILRDAAARLADAGVETPQVDAELLLAHVLQTDRAGLYARAEAMTPDETDEFDCLLARRADREPLQHLTGEAGFFGLSLLVRSGVFVPRPETETLVEAILEVLAGISAPRVVDTCTGTGAVALAVKAARPDATVLAVDGSEDAVALTRENAGRLGLEVEVRRGDLLGPVPAALDGEIDAILANPPYVTDDEYAQVSPEVRRDPREALLGGTRVHARLAEEAPARLRPGGWLVMEIGETQGGEVSGLLQGYDEVEVLTDLAGRDRVVRGRMPRA